MLLGSLKIRHLRQKHRLQSKQEAMVKPIENTKPISIILNWMFKTIVLIFFAMIIIFPFYFMINQSLLDKNWQTRTDTIVWYPQPFPGVKESVAFNWYNFKAALEGGYGKAILFTAATTALSVVLRLFFSITFGYAFSLKNWKMKKLSWVLFLALLVLPEVALLSGQYLVTVKLNWHLGKWRVIALTMPFAASVFSGFMYRNAFEAIPNSVRESALIDGANGFKFFTKIAMPMVKSTTWTIAILTALASWNSYMWPLTILGKAQPGDWTVINIWLFSTGKDALDPDPSRIFISIRMAATILAILPMFIVYFILRKRIMNAISRQGNATKG